VMIDIFARIISIRRYAYLIYCLYLIKLSTSQDIFNRLLFAKPSKEARASLLTVS
jgi:hypothetical protein